MEVTYKKFTFNTDDMRSFATGVSSMPTIFVNENRLCFVLINRTRWEKPIAKHLSRSEAMRYAKAYRLEELSAYLAAIRERAEGSSEVAGV